MIEKNLTKRQLRLYNYVYEFIVQNNKSPTLGELVRKTGKAKSTICAMLHRIEKKGYIKVKNNKARGIKVVQDVNNIELCKNGIKEEEYVKYGLSKSNK